MGKEVSFPLVTWKRFSLKDDLYCCKRFVSKSHTHTHTHTRTNGKEIVFRPIADWWVYTPGHPLGGGTSCDGRSSEDVLIVREIYVTIYFPNEKILHSPKVSSKFSVLLLTCAHYALKYVLCHFSVPNRESTEL